MYIPGIRISTVAAGIKYPDHQDLTLFEICASSQMSGVFTQNAFCAAPVTICKQHLEHFSTEQPYYLLINTGNANAGTGKLGDEYAQRCCQQLAALTTTKQTQIFPFSTGVIGETLPIKPIIDHLPLLLKNLDKHHWEQAASAIMTTDTVPKFVSRQLTIQGETITISGISKGSGMIRPDMATMLAFVATDLTISKTSLDQLIAKMANASFNRITVDGDTSTNDSCMLIATGQSKSPCYDALSSDDQHKFTQVLEEVFVHLAKAIILDGEGATKLINIQINQARNQQECLDIAYTIAHSPLVKTAFFASDPNWGRILAAIGRSNIPDLNINALSISLDKLCIVNNGGRATTYTEQAGQAIMEQDEISIIVDLARGSASERIWTCDFSYDYVKINAEYRT